MADDDDIREGPAISCFVIGPIGDRDAAHGSPERNTYEQAVQVWEEVILPACEAFGIIPVRADHISKSGEIPEQIFRRLRDDQLVIADLTKANPNVMYELGLRHTTGKLTIQIGEKEHLPFDLAAIRTIRFRRTEASLIDARKQLAVAIGAGLKDGGDPVTAARVWFEKLGAPALPAPSAQDEETGEELGFLEKLSQMTDGMAGLTRTAENIAAITNEITVLVRQATDKTTRVNTLGGTAGARAEIADRLAKSLEDPAIRLDVLAGEYRQSVDRADPGMVYLLTRIRENPDLQKEAPGFIPTISQLLRTIDGVTPSITSFRTSLLEAGEATKALRRINRRIANALDVMINANMSLGRWSELLSSNGSPEPT